MKRKYFAQVLTLLLLSLMTLFITGCDGPMPTRDQIVTKYPDVDLGSLRAENIEVLCPFVRMLERAGIFDAELDGQPTMEVASESLVSAAKEFGCATLECRSVVNTVSDGQGLAGVDIGQLHLAGSLAHDCGLTFAFGGTTVSDTVRQTTLDSLEALADIDGHLSFANIETVKLDICASRGVTITSGGETEIKLIYAYLGGVDRGYILHSDVVKLFDAEMPETISTRWMNAILLSSVQ